MVYLNAVKQLFCVNINQEITSIFISRKEFISRNVYFVKL